MRVMRETEQRRPRLRRLGDELGAWYTPIALATASLAWVMSREPKRFLATVVVATPCPLLIAIPVAVIGAISRSARRGIIIKNPAVLEQVDRCRTLIFDKTGTLTYGKPTLFQVVAASGFEANEVLRLAARLESYSKHPLSGAILEAAQKAGLAAEPVAEINERLGEGLQGRAGNRKVWIAGGAEPRHCASPVGTGSRVRGISRRQVRGDAPFSRCAAPGQPAVRQPSEAAP
jgi:cation transport ATPase